jgi:hypothetical protein
MSAEEKAQFIFDLLGETLEQLAKDPKVQKITQQSRRRPDQLSGASSVTNLCRAECCGKPRKSGEIALVPLAAPIPAR